MFRKSILFVALTAMVGMLSAQSLHFEYQGQALENNEIVVCDSVTEWGEMLMEMKVFNKTSDPLNVVIEKEEVQMVEGTTNYFCWGLCYTPTTITSDPRPVEANSLSTDELSFHQNLDPEFSGNFLVGTSVVKYYAYPDRNPDDKVCVVVWFAYQAESVEDQGLTIGEAYPNPASNTVSFNVNHTGTLQAVVYNLLGQEVKSQWFNGVNKVSFSVEDLQPGIYFCSFIADGQACKTEKFIVKR